MGIDWNIRETSIHCATCGKEFQEGQEISSMLAETQTSFERRDYCAGCWAGVEQSAVFSQWHTVMPKREVPVNRKVNAQVVLDFFHKLEGEQERQKLCFRYVLGLMLMRKKIMKFGGVNRGEGGEELILSDSRTGVEYRVYDPGLSEEEITSLTDEVGKLLNIRFETATDQPPAGAVAEAPAQEPTT